MMIMANLYILPKIMLTIDTNVKKIHTKEIMIGNKVVDNTITTTVADVDGKNDGVEREIDITLIIMMNP